MKRRIFSILFALVLACSLGLVTAVPAGAQVGVNYYVNAATGDDTHTAEAAKDPITPWLTIQHAIDTVPAESTINVATGTYLQDDQITVDESVIIKGAGREDTEVRRAGTPVYGQYWNVFNVTAASDVTIRDMTVGYETLLPATPATPVPGYVIAVGGGYSPTDNLTIDNVAFDGGRSAILSSGTGLVVQKCLFTGEWQRASIRPTGTDFLITGNEFQGLHYQYGPVMLDGDAIEGEISYNQMSNGAIPGYFKTSGSVFTIESYTNATGTGNLVIKNNTFDGTNRTDVVKEGGNPLYTLAIYFEGAGYDGSKIFIQDNPTFTGYDYGVWVPGTTTVSGNEFNSNGTQLGLYEAVGGIPETAIDDILANNTFDRAVVVDHASLLPTIWSSIQDGIDAAAERDTINVAAGIYAEHIVITEPNLTLIGEDRETTIIDATQDSSWPVAKPGILIGEYPLVDGVHGVKVSGFTIRDAEMQEGGVPYEGEKYGVGPQAQAGILIYNSSNNTIENNILSNNHWQIFVCAEWPAEGYTECMNNRIAVNIIMDSENDGVYLYSDGGVFVQDTEIVNNEISNAYGEVASGVEFWGWPEGGPTPTISGTVVKGNLITGCTYGVRIRDDVSDITGTSVNYNNFVDNTNYGLLNDTSATVDATNNWWGNASGPADEVAYENMGYEGYGDKVSGNVSFEPWLLAEVNIAEVAKEILPTTYDKTLALKDVWTLISTDKLVATTGSTWVGTNDLSPEDPDTVITVLAYEYTPGEGYPQVVLPDGLEPIDALYVKTAGGGGVGINYSASAPGVSSKDLVAGWNLISSGTIADAGAVLSPLRDIATEGTGLTTLVSQGSYNQHTIGWYVDATTWENLSGDMNPFDGYWIYMNAAKSFGVPSD